MTMAASSNIALRMPAQKDFRSCNEVVDAFLLGETITVPEEALRTVVSRGRGRAKSTPIPDSVCARQRETYHREKGKLSRKSEVPRN